MAPESYTSFSPIKIFVSSIHHPLNVNCERMCAVATPWPVINLERSNCNSSYLLISCLFAPEEHGVGDHGQEQKRDRTQEPLHARESAVRQALEDGQPQVLVKQLMPGHDIKHLSSVHTVRHEDRKVATDPAIALVGGQPVATNKQCPADMKHLVYLRKVSDIRLLTSLLKNIL